MPQRVVVVGGGVGGLVVANRLARARPNLVVTLIDSHGDHVYQAGSLDVAFGEAEPGRLRRPTRTLIDRRVELRVERVAGIDRAARRLTIDGGGTLPYDLLVLASGSQLDRAGCPPGFREGAKNFHCPRAATDLRDTLAGFAGGHVVVGATRLPYKCPPSPVEFVLRLDGWLRRRGLRDATRLTYLYPLPAVLPGPEFAAWAARLMHERGIEALVPFVVAAVDPGRRRVADEHGMEVPYDLLVLVPPHSGAPFLRGGDLADEAGFVPADPATLRAGDGIYCLGDAARLPAPKTGSAARRQAQVVVDNVLAELDGRVPRAAYDGRVT